MFHPSRQVDGKPGGELGDTELIHGIVIDKEFSHPQVKGVTNVVVRSIFLFSHFFSVSGRGNGQKLVISENKKARSAKIAVVHFPKVRQSRNRKDASTCNASCQMSNLSSTPH